MSFISEVVEGVTDNVTCGFDDLPLTDCSRERLSNYPFPRG